MEPKKTVLFVCEFNSCRSQLAEALAGQMFPNGWLALSAGLARTIVNDETVRALKEVGIEAAGLSSKSLDEVRAESVDDVVVLARPAVQAARLRFPAARVLEWPMEDPIQVAGGPEAVRAAVRSARDELARRLGGWLHGRGAP